MRWNRKQLDEANEDARAKGFKEGRKFARRRAFLGFFFGIAFGAAGFYVALFYNVQIIAYAHHLVKQFS